MDGAFRRRTIVTCDVHEQCVIHLAHLLERIQYATNLSIGVREETCKHFHQSRSHRLITIWILIPRWHFIGTCSECSSFGDDTK